MCNKNGWIYIKILECSTMWLQYALCSFFRRLVRLRYVRCSRALRRCRRCHCADCNSNGIVRDILQRYGKKRHSLWYVQRARLITDVCLCQGYGLPLLPTHFVGVRVSGNSVSGALCFLQWLTLLHQSGNHPWLSFGWKPGCRCRHASFSFLHTYQQ